MSGSERVPVKPIEWFFRVLSQRLRQQTGMPRIQTPCIILYPLADAGLSRTVRIPHLRCRPFRRSGSSGWAQSWDGSGPESSVWGQNRQDPLPFTVELRFTNVLHVGGPKDQIVLSLEAGDKLCLDSERICLAVRSWSQFALKGFWHALATSRRMVHLCSFVRNSRSCGTTCCECKATSRQFKQSLKLVV